MNRSFALSVLLLVATALAGSGCAGVVCSSQGAPGATGGYAKKITAASGEMAGNTTCWECHKQESHVQSSGKTVNCMDCHQPDYLAVKDVHAEKTRKACNFKTFVNISKLPKAEQTKMCMDCHCALATFALHNWNASTHNLAGVSCLDCHNVHHGGDLKPKRSDIDALCYGCHQDVRAAFELPTHHPLREGKMACIDCHDPHGSASPTAMLRKETVKETCTRCHSEKEGPYVFEHADLMEDCTVCHMAHGSQNDMLLVERMPFLCKQCHPQHPLFDKASLRRFGGNCTNCHSQIHGSDLNNPLGTGEGFFLR